MSPRPFWRVGAQDILFEGIYLEDFRRLGTSSPKTWHCSFGVEFRDLEKII